MQNTLKKSLVFLTVFALFMAMSFTVTIDSSHAASAPKNITLKAQSKTVDVGASLKISVSKATPKKASKNVTWKIVKGKKNASLVKKKNTSVYINGKKAGSVTIKAISKSNKKVTKSITVNVKNLTAKKVALNATAKNVGVGKTSTIKATVTAPQKYGYKSQTTKWSSSIVR